MDSKLHLKHFSAEEKILWMTGTHGSKEGVSALTETKTMTADDDGRLTELNLIVHGFYREDCAMVGIKAGPDRTNPRGLEGRAFSEQRPFSDKEWEKLIDITKPAKKLDNPSPDSFCNDALMKDIDVRVANIPYYYKNGEKLIRDINEACLIK